MVKRKIDKQIIKVVQAYINEVKKHYRINIAYLFGSYAKGTQHEDSDIDIAVISNDIRNSYTDLVKMMKFRRNIDLRIEPHPIKTEDYNNNSMPIISEIIKTGIPVYAT